MGLGLERLEPRIALATDTWTGADALLTTNPNDNWSDKNNWHEQNNKPVVPATGDSLVFPTGLSGAALTSNDDLTGTISFAALTIQNSGYTITGSAGVTLNLTGPIDSSQGSGSSAVNLPVAFGSNPETVTVDTAGATLALGGVVSGSATLTKSGSGQLNLSAVNTYTGTTAVSGGILHVDGSVSGAVTVGSGATLGGIGTVGSIAATSATLSPGDTTPGTLTDTGALTLDSGSTYTVTLNSDTVYSQTKAAGAISLGSATLDLTFGSGFTPTGKDQFTIIKNTGSGPITGTFAGLAEGAIVTASGEHFRISYKGGAGKDVVLTHLVDTTTTLSPVTTSPVFGQAVALTAIVKPSTSGLGTPTGSVDFKSGTTDLGPAPLNSSGIATLNTTSLAISANSITAVYSGDSTFGTSTSPSISVTVGQASSSTTLTTSPNPSVAGQGVTLTAHVTAVSPGSGIPTGTVEFFNGSTDLGPGALSGGVATLQTSSLPVGSDPIRAVYSGDTFFTAGPAGTATQQVNLGGPTVTVSTPTTNPFGLTAVPLTATVTVPVVPGQPTTPTGTVTFFDIHGTNLGSRTLANGTATLTVTSLPAGKESITAVYSGDSNFAGAASPPRAMVVGSRSELFVNQVYEDVFGAPAGELESYWVALLNGGYPSKRVARYIVQSTDAKAATVENAYEFYLGRPATPTEQVRAVSARNPSLIELNASLLGSREFYQTRGGGTTRGFLTALAHAVLGTAFAPRVQSQLAGQLERGVSRRQVALEVLTSPNGVNAEVNHLVKGILDRPATRTEVARFGPLVKRGQSSQVAVDLFGSREFTRKFVDIT